SEEPVEKRDVRGWFPGSEQALELFPAEFELPEPLVLDHARYLLGRDATLRGEPVLLMPEGIGYPVHLGGDRDLRMGIHDPVQECGPRPGASDEKDERAHGKQSPCQWRKNSREQDE